MLSKTQQQISSRILTDQLSEDIVPRSAHEFLEKILKGNPIIFHFIARSTNLENVGSSWGGSCSWYSTSYSWVQHSFI
eukprot:snap_masked-scaffold_28-processed-gene-1.13-mRNA-1 protein AED:1.00 eAED:1.00 QI:0/0/0/0/1/1/2/0/77